MHTLYWRFVCSINILRGFFNYFFIIEFVYNKRLLPLTELVNIGWNYQSTEKIDKII